MTTFLRILKWTIAAIYLAIIVAYVFLFVILMRLIKKTYP